MFNAINGDPVGDEVGDTNGDDGFIVSLSVFFLRENTSIK